MSTTYVYFFGGGKADGNAEMKNLLGGKGANLAEMTNLAIPVPAGFTVSTEVCTYFYDHGGEYPDALRSEVDQALRKVEEEMGAAFTPGPTGRVSSAGSNADEGLRRSSHR